MESCISQMSCHNIKDYRGMLNMDLLRIVTLWSLQEMVASGRILKQTQRRSCLYNSGPKEGIVPILAVLKFELTTITQAVCYESEGLLRRVGHLTMFVHTGAAIKGHMAANEESLFRCWLRQRP